MTLIRAVPLYFPPPAASPGVRRLEAWRNGTPREADVAPPLDVARLRRKYGPHTLGRPRLREALFTAPRATDRAVYERARNAAIAAWLDREASEGWDWTGDRIKVRPIDIPAQAEDGTPDPDRQVLKAGTTFRQRNGRVVRVELDPVLLAPTYPAGRQPR